MPASKPPEHRDALAWPELPRVTVRAVNTPAELVLQRISQAIGYPVILEADLAPVTGDWRDADAKAVLEAIARRNRLHARWTGRGVEIGEQEPRTARYFNTGFARAESLVEVVNASFPGVVASVVGQRLLVTGRTESVEAVAGILEELEFGPDGWLVRATVYQLSNEFRRSLGASLSGVGVVRAEVATSGSDVSGSGVLEVLAEASASGSGAELVTDATLFVLEGSEASLNQGEVIRVPRRVFTDGGTISDTGFEAIRTGVLLTVRARRVPGGVLLDVAPEISGVLRIRDGVPDTVERSIRAAAILESGDRWLLAGLDDVAVRSRADGQPIARYLGERVERDFTASSVVIVLQATRIYASRPEVRP